MHNKSARLVTLRKVSLHTMPLYSPDLTTVSCGDWRSRYLCLVACITTARGFMDKQTQLSSTHRHASLDVPHLLKDWHTHLIRQSALHSGTFARNPHQQKYTHVYIVCVYIYIWLWIKNAYPNWNPGKWNPKLKPAAP